MKEIKAYKCEYCGNIFFEKKECQCVKDYSDTYRDKLYERIQWYIYNIRKWDYVNFKVIKWSKNYVKIQFYNNCEGFESYGFMKLRYDDLNIDLNDFKLKHIIKEQNNKLDKIDLSISKYRSEINRLKIDKIKEKSKLDKIKINSLYDKNGDMIYEGCFVKNEGVVSNVKYFEIIWDYNSNYWSILCRKKTNKTWDKKTYKCNVDNFIKKSTIVDKKKIFY